MKNKIKNIVYFASNNISKKTADVINIMEMCNALVNNNINTILVVPESGVKKEKLFENYGIKNSFEVIEINVPAIFEKKILPGQGAIFAFLALVKTNQKSSLYFTRNIWFFFLSIVFFKKKCVFETHQFRFKRRVLTRLYHFMIQYCAKSKYGYIVSISKALKTQWVSLGIDENKILIAHDAVNLEKFNTSYTKAEARKLLSLNLSSNIVVYTGSLISGKGVDVLIQCANRLPSITFIIVGGEKKQIQSYRKLVKSKNVVFIEHVQHTEIPLYQASADILVLPNTKGSVIDDVTSPLKLFEYLASERPIIASKMPSLLEILNNKNAVLCQAGNTNEFSKNIELIIDNPEFGIPLVNHAKRDIEKYSWDARVLHLCNLFETLNFSN